MRISAPRVLIVDPFGNGANGSIFRVMNAQGGLVPETAIGGMDLIRDIGLFALQEMGEIQAFEALQELRGQHKTCAVAHMQFAPAAWLRLGFLAWPHDPEDEHEEPGYVVMREIDVHLESAK